VTAREPGDHRPGELGSTNDRSLSEGHDVTVVELDSSAPTNSPATLTCPPLGVPLDDDDVVAPVGESAGDPTAPDGDDVEVLRVCRGDTA
jgi:hypothetical protein